MDSASQQAWMELAARVRELLAQSVEKIPDMEPHELGLLVEALSEAMSLEASAAVFDKQIQLQLDRISYGD